MTDANTSIKGYSAGEELAAYDIVKLSTAGELVKVAAAEATDSLGVVSSTGGYATVTAKDVSYVESGRTKVYALVESSTTGYADDIAVGDALVISGKTAGTRGLGQAVSKWVSTMPADAIVGKALTAVAGNTTSDTYSLIDVEWD